LTHAQHDLEDVRARAKGQWVRILSRSTGISESILDGEHHACPKGHGKDCFRFSDMDGNGSIFCSKCHDGKQGDGFGVISWMTGQSFPEAIETVAEIVGSMPAAPAASPPQPKADPAKNLVFQEWCEETDAILVSWCEKKRPVHPEAVKAVRGRIARYYGTYTVIALPVLGQDLNYDKPVGWSLYNATGGTLPKSMRRDKERKEVKVKLTYGSEKGIICDLARLRRSTEAWKVEGPSDCLTALSDTTMPDDVAPFTNANGAGENPEDWLIELMAGKKTRVLHDADSAGELGALGIEPKSATGKRKIGWVEALASKATECRHVRLPYQVNDDEGRDLRDWYNGIDRDSKGSYTELRILADASPLFRKVQGPAKSDYFSNAVIERNGKSNEIVPLPVADIIADLNTRTGNWPRRVGGMLFVHDGQRVDNFSKVPALFGWIGNRTGRVDWHREVGCVSKEEAFAEILRTAPSYKAIETLPHFPALPGHYYATPTLPKCNDRRFRELVDRFSPASDVDYHLLTGFFATPFWGGAGGTRPVWMIAAPEGGRGSGKSKLPDMLNELLDKEPIQLQADADADRVRTRLLTPGEGLSARVAIFDNVKSLRLSSADFESMITSPTIGGHQLFNGQASRPNTLTYVMTLNAPSLSTDFAKRVIPIHVQRPEYDSSWEEETRQFIRQYRLEIFEGIRQFFEIVPEPILHHTRWAPFEKAIISRLPDPNEIMDVIRQRTDQANAELDEIEIIEDYFEEQLENFGYESFNPQRVHICPEIYHSWFMGATGKRSYSRVDAGKILKQFIDEGQTKKLKNNPSHKVARGFIFEMQQCDPSSAVDYKLKEMWDKRVNSSY
jgi:hypothetical protein